MPKALREFSSGGAVFRGGLWLVRSTMPSKLFPKSYWMLPKGWIDDAGEGVPGEVASGKRKATEEELQATASREVKEEAGIEARILKKIGSISFPYNHPIRGKVLKFVTYYLMEWQKDLPEGFGDETNEVLWLSFNEAYKKLTFQIEKDILKEAKEKYFNNTSS